MLIANRNNASSLDNINNENHQNYVMGRVRDITKRQQVVYVDKLFEVSIIFASFQENGVFWEECYCSDDACNSAILNSPNIALSCLISAIWILLT